jgi:phosphate starvation-inducible protein PhoH
VLSLAQKRRIDYTDVPEKLNNHIFYGMKLNKEQTEFRNAIWDKGKDIIFCDSAAGTGKTTIAFATALMLVKYGLFDGITYIVSPYGESKQGYLPGSIFQKSQIYFQPVYDALEVCRENTNIIISQDDAECQKYGDSIISCVTHTFLRGTNLLNRVIILDEAQNYSEDDLRKTLTRVGTKTKAIVIGHSGQIDLQNKNLSGFEKCIRHFKSKNDDRTSFHELTENFRGWVSQAADEPWEE